MYVERAVVIIEKIFNEKPKLNNWELDFLLTICRIGASGKIKELTEAQASSLVSILFKKVLLPKTNEIIDISGHKCNNCEYGVIECSETGPTRCHVCNGHGYKKI